MTSFKTYYRIFQIQFKFQHHIVSFLGKISQILFISIYNVVVLHAFNRNQVSSMNNRRIIAPIDVKIIIVRIHSLWVCFAFWCQKKNSCDINLYMYIGLCTQVRITFHLILKIEPKGVISGKIIPSSRHGDYHYVTHELSKL